MTEKVAEHLVSLIRRHGVEHVFGVPSGDWLPYMESMKKGGVEFVLVANEASAGFMATVYGWLRNVPGVCYATIGPGATNLSTGIGSAFLDRSPVIALTSEPSESMRGRTTQMAIDQHAFLKPITKWSTRLNESTMDGVFQKAVHIATSEYPGPVHISLPGDIANKDVPATRPYIIPTPVLASPDDASIRRVEDLFKKAKRPILAVGLSAVRLGLGDYIKSVAERHNIPVVLTPMAKGLISEDHPSYAGVLFHALSNRVADTYRQADLVVGIGYDPVEFNYEEWMPEVDLIHMDSVPADIDAMNYPSVLNVIGHPGEALKRLTEMDSILSEWDMKALEERRNAMFAEFIPKGDFFGPLSVLSILRELLPDEGIMTCDVGSHTHLIGQAWRTPHPYGQIMTNGWSSMGFGIPAAIGAKIAQPEREVVCVTGDGSFMMMAGEMATANRMGLNIVVIVLADRTLELIKIKQGRKSLEVYGTTLSNKDIPSPESMFGVPILTVKDEDSYREALEKAFRIDGPVIIEALIDPSEYNGLILQKHK
ncbi:MAG: thiamine pyrophosphate-binding protein [Spirochaetia bacterium]|jgi:acetolactate synthase-1/2/3 large subunit|nr:thiamine pyrophosphate-binding protein [Spirochaetia bacterium]